jgi:hypothetical protein
MVDFMNIKPDEAAKLDRQSNNLPGKFDPKRGIEVARMALKNYRFKVRELELSAESKKIETAEDEKSVAEMILQIRKLQGKIDEAVKSLTGEHAEFIGAVKNIGNEFSDGLSNAETGLRDKFGKHQFFNELKRRASEKNAQAELENIQKQIDAEAQRLGIESINLPTAYLPEKVDPVRCELGTVTTHFKPKIIIEDESKIPPEYMGVDMKKINAAVKAGLTIPGVKIEKSPSVYVRLAK